MAAILDFIADHPGQSFSLTDLVRALKLSRATCHALLMGLVEVGYLYRANDKNYVLGPALARISRVAAADSGAPLQVAQPEIRALADAYDAICTVFCLEGDEIVVRDRAASVSHLGYSIPPGSRMKLRVNSSGVLYAWTAPEELETLLDALQPTPTPEDRATLQQGIRFVRQHGFSFYTRNPQAPVATEGSSLYFPAGPSFDLKPDQQYSVGALIAPVFDDQGRVAYILALVGLNGKISGTELEAVGHRLRAACDRITSFLGGREPRLTTAVQGSA